MIIDAMKHMEPDGAIRTKHAPVDTALGSTERLSRLMVMSSTETELLKLSRERLPPSPRAAKEP